MIDLLDWFSIFMNIVFLLNRINSIWLEMDYVL